MRLYLAAAIGAATRFYRGLLLLLLGQEQILTAAVKYLPPLLPRNFPLLPTLSIERGKEKNSFSSPLRIFLPFFRLAKLSSRIRWTLSPIWVSARDRILLLKDISVLKSPVKDGKTVVWLSD